MAATTGQELADPASTVEGTVLAEAVGNLALLNVEGRLDKKAEAVKALLIQCEGDFLYELKLFVNGRVLMTQPVNQKMNPAFDKAAHAIVWLSFHQSIHSWRFEFTDVGQENIFKLQLAYALLQHGRQEDLSKGLKSSEDQWVMDGLTLNEEDEETDVSDDDEMEFENRGGGGLSPSKRAGATFLKIGSAGDHAIVGRGTAMEIYKYDEYEQLALMAEIPQIKDLEGELIAPSTTLLHDRDEKMLMLHPTKTDVICMADMNRGEIVEEWKASEGLHLKNIASRAKYSILTGEQVFTGVAKNGIFSIDPRTSGKDKIAEKYQYSRSCGLSCAATTGTGAMAVGSSKGEIRLFKGPGGKAKTCLPGLGHAITGIDVTEAGDFILATTKSYLMLIPTSIPEDKKGRTGFDVGMANKSKPRPIKLQLQHVDVIKYGIQEVNFTPATFNTGHNITEQWVVASTGSYVITWNLNRVKQGKRDYIIKREGEDIAASMFRFNAAEQVVVSARSELYTERLCGRKR